LTELVPYFTIKLTCVNYKRGAKGMLDSLKARIYQGSEYV